MTTQRLDACRRSLGSLGRRGLLLGATSILALPGGVRQARAAADRTLGSTDAAARSPAPTRGGDARAIASSAGIVDAKPALPMHEPFGRLTPPQAALPLAMLRDDARRIALPRLLEGQVTAVQLMFTGCSAICPIQGALFAEVARRLASIPDARLLSLSIDPLGDDPRALRAWLDRFAASAAWRAAAPRVVEVEPLLASLRGRAAGIDSHVGQVFIFDRRARLVFRTPELPPAGYVADLLDQASGET